MSIGRFLSIALITAAIHQTAAAADPECSVDAYVCPRTAKEIAKHNVDYLWQPDLLGDKPPVKVSVEATCDLAGKDAVNTSLGKIATGHYPGSDHCAVLKTTKEYKAFGLKKGAIVGPCGDFVRGDNCPAPHGG